MLVDANRVRTVLPTAMKHLKSSSQDLRRIFRSSITAREIAEPLFTLEGGIPVSAAKKALLERSFDVAGIRINGDLVGYVHVDDLVEGIDQIPTRHFTGDDLIDESDSIFSAFEALRSANRVFMQFLGQPSGIITRGDLQKAPVRMWLFGMITLLEMEMTFCIRREYGERPDWQQLLPEKRLAEARKTHKKKIAIKEETCLLDCLQIADKGTLIAKTPTLLSLTGCNSKNEWNRMLGRIERLRNDLAHGDALMIGEWAKICERVEWIESVLISLEKTRKNKRP